MKTKIFYLIIISLLILSIAIIESDKSFNDIFSNSKDKKENISNKADNDSAVIDNPVIPASKEVSLIAVGDISYSRGVERMTKRNSDIYYPFLKIRDYLSNSDILFANLETTITEGREIKDNEMVFRSNPGTENVLKDVGFSIVSLANNHTSDFGQKGILDTMNYLDNVDIKYIGAGKNIETANSPVYIEVNNNIFSFLAYNNHDVVPDFYEASETRAGTVFMRIEKMQEAVKEAKNKSDFVIVSMHSGIEYVYEPNKVQIDFARAAIDSGADLVLGHHPHVVQSIERYKDKFIFYSLGNFIFDQSWSQATKEGIVVKFYFNNNNVEKIEVLPVVSEKLAQPRPANKEEAKRILNRLQYSLNASDNAWYSIIVD